MSGENQENQVHTLQIKVSDPEYQKYKETKNKNGYTWRQIIRKGVQSIE